MLQVGEYRDLADAVRALSSEGLDGRARSLFGRLGWFTAMQSLCLPDHRPLIAHAHEGASGALLFLTQAPGKPAEALANWYSFRFAPVFTGDPDPATQLHLLVAIAEHLRRTHRRISLYPLIDTDGSLSQLTQAFRAAGWLALSRPEGANHILPLDGRGFAAYWEGRPGHLRNLVARKSRRAEGLTLTVHDRFDPAVWDAYEAVYAQSWKPHEGSMPFLRAMAEMEGAGGRLRMGLATLDGEPVAAQLWTLDQGTALIHKLAYVEGHAAVSPGTLLTHAMMRHAIELDRVGAVDLGVGDDPYKRDWMEVRRPLHRLDLFDTRSPAVWPAALRRGISQLVHRPHSH